MGLWLLPRFRAARSSLEPKRTYTGLKPIRPQTDSRRRLQLFRVQSNHRLPPSNATPKRRRGVVLKSDARVTGCVLFRWHLLPGLSALVECWIGAGARAEMKAI